MPGIYSVFKVLLLIPFLAEKDIFLLVTENSLLLKRILLRFLILLETSFYNCKLIKQVREWMNMLRRWGRGDFLNNYYTSLKKKKKVAYKNNQVNVCVCPSSLHVEDLTLNMMGFGDRAFRR